MAILELTLADGRRIRAAAIHVASTYSHVYEGLPSRKSNDGYLAAFPERVKRIFNGPFPVFVVEPERRVEAAGVRVATREPAEYLPSQWCAAEFYDDAMSRCLVVVWFQHEAFPMPAATIRPNLEAVEWEKHAREFDP